MTEKTETRDKTLAVCFGICVVMFSIALSRMQNKIDAIYEKVQQLESCEEKETPNAEQFLE